MNRIYQKAMKSFILGTYMKLLDLEKELSARQGSTRAAYLAARCRAGDFLCTDLIDLTFHRNGVLAFHAAWVLEHVFLAGGAPKVEWEYFFKRYIDQRNKSCQRHFTKIAIYFFNEVSTVTNVDLESVMERTMEWLADEGTPVAVKANCIDILFALRGKEDWLAEELTFQLEFIIRKGTSAALQSRTKKFLAKLSKERKL